MDVLPEMLNNLNVLLWQEHPGSQICGQTLTSDHHDELIKLGIRPSLRGTGVTHKFPYVIFCAPPYGNLDYPGEVRFEIYYLYKLFKGLLISLFSVYMSATPLWAFYVICRLTFLFCRKYQLNIPLQTLLYVINK